MKVPIPFPRLSDLKSIKWSAKMGMQNHMSILVSVSEGEMGLCPQVTRPRKLSNLNQPIFVALLDLS